MNEAQWFYEDRGARIGPVVEAEIKALLRSRKIGHGTLVWHTGMSDWVTVETSELKEELSSRPPPLARDRVSELWVWLIAASPIIWLLVDPTAINGGVAAYWFAVIILCAIDQNKLRSAGYQPTSMWWSLFLPGYFYFRSRVLKASQAPLIVWTLINVGLFFIPRY